MTAFYNRSPRPLNLWWLSGDPHDPDWRSAVNEVQRHVKEPEPPWDRVVDVLGGYTVRPEFPFLPTRPANGTCIPPER